MTQDFASTGTQLYSQFIFKSRYSRWLEDKKRRETWPETVQRYIDFFKNRFPQLENEIQALYEPIFNLEVLPSMRALMTAGPALERDNCAIFNCSYLVVDSSRAFDEMMYASLCGVGVGFSVERQYINKLPEVSEEMHDTESVIVVSDSKIGWASAYRELVSLLYAGKVPSWDMHKVRPAGAPLKVFGGRASGPEPLEDLFMFTVNIFKKAKGRKLTSLECHDLICKIAEVVVVGGTRRSATLSLSNPSDERMRMAKSGQWWQDAPHRALANNSIAYTEKPSFDLFLKEWHALYESKSGERGMFNRTAAKKQAAKTGRREVDHDFGCNPCCVTGDTTVLTDEGHFHIDVLVGQEVSVWNGENFAKVRPFATGTWPIYRVHLSDGTTLDCTENHKFVVHHRYNKKAEPITSMVETKNLTIGAKMAKYSMPYVLGMEGQDPEVDAYSQGFYSGDGSTDLEYSLLYSTKYMCEDRLVGEFKPDRYNRRRWIHGPMVAKDFVPVNASGTYCLNWLAGLLDSDGTVTRDRNGNGLQICSIDRRFLSNVQLMLTRLGAKTKIVSGHPEGKRLMPDGRGGKQEYHCKETYRLIIGNTDTATLKSVGLVTNRLVIHSNEPQRDARRFVTVLKVEDLNTELPTYCFEEPKTHRGTFNGIVTGQSEIILRPNSFCNLTEIVVRPGDTEEDLARKTTYATILGTLQSTVTDFRYLRSVWKKNAEEERLLGVSMTGVMDHPVLNNVNEEAKKILTTIRSTSIEVNKVWASKLGINQSTSITCIKPAGTTSQLTNTASGLHPRFSKYYIRRVRGDSKDPLCTFMKEAGFPCETDVMNKTNVVFSFPIKSPDNCVTVDDIGAMKQLEHWKMMQDEYCEHKPSITVYHTDEEFLEVGAWVWKNFDDISGISFLPKTDHVYKQAPYEAITEEKYNELAASMPTSIDWEALAIYETEDRTTGTQELACSSGVCDLSDFGSKSKLT